jgi:hypothetical protein
LRYDQLGVCVSEETREGCDDTERVLQMVPTTVVEYETGTAVSKRTVHERHYSARVVGRLKIRRGDQGRIVPLDLTVERSDAAYWTPHGSKRYATRSLVDVIREARSRVTRVVQDATREEVATRARRVEPVVGAGLPPDELEHRIVIAALGTRQLSEPGASYLEATYGLGRVAAEDVMRRRPRRRTTPTPPARLLPSPASSPWEDQWSDYAVEADVRDDDLPPERAGGMDVAFKIDGSPLASSARVHGPLLRFRAEEVQLETWAGSANLGGDASGFGVDLSFLLDDVPFDGVYLSIGAAFEETRNEAGERTRFLGAPVRLVWPGFDAASIWASVGVNALALETLIDDDPDDPAYVWPLSLGATIDVTSRFYVEGRGTHYLLSGTDEALHVALEIGARL